MNVADPRSGNHSLAAVSRGDFCENAVEVERERRHLQLTSVVLPFLARPVAVDLDPVPLRVVEIERLGHEMVGCAREPVSGARYPVHGAGKLVPCRQEEREVKQSRRPRRAPRRLGPMNERHER